MRGDKGATAALPHSSWPLSLISSADQLSAFSQQRSGCPAACPSQFDGNKWIAAGGRPQYSPQNSERAELSRFLAAPIWKHSNLDRKPFWPPPNMSLVHPRARTEDESHETLEEET
ncbi:MAG: hypothetical protein DMG32_23665 [Acidobacteria bacterium]|nr:MAG: hypothetical protein DMG32_23665 [Acidobacteriota bacterium]